MFEVRQVPGKGRGLIATQDLPAGHCIGSYSTEGGDCWCMMVADFRYANHSAGKPNIKWCYRDGIIAFFTLCQIKTGEELVYDYNCDLWFTPV
jgi:hypothetical protein